MKANLNTRERTVYLKGFAISAVLINHYVNNFISGEFYEYANGIVAIFFILSGYGIFYSIQKDFSSGSSNWRRLLNYYLKRAVRIYPLYWLAMFLLALGPYKHHYTSEIKTLLAIPFYQAPDIFWFVTSLVQCYLIAPCIYFLMKRTSTLNYIIIILCLLFLSYFLYPMTSLPYSRRFFVYRYLFLGHLFLFMLGMSLPNLLAGYHDKFTNKTIALISFFLFLLMVFYTRMPMQYVPPFFVISAVSFCCYFISISSRMIFRRTFVLLGCYSYALYLFHIFFFSLLHKLGVIRNGSLTSVLITMLVFPLFLFGCAMIEKNTSNVMRSFYQWQTNVLR
jgi:peptidoglycan/LPS O-acetylase OafA/YrhL